MNHFWICGLAIAGALRTGHFAAAVVIVIASLTVFYAPLVPALPVRSALMFNGYAAIALCVLFLVLTTWI